MSNIPPKAAAVLAAHFKDGPRTTPPASTRLSGLLTAPLLQQMDVLGASRVDFVDSACGTGAVTREVQRLLSPEAVAQSSFVCGDSSAGMVDTARRTAREEGWVNVRRVDVMDAMDTQLADDSATHVAVGMGLHLIPAPDEVIRDAMRVLRPGGTFGASTFPEDNTFWASDVRAALASLPYEAPFPEKLPVQMHDSGRWYDPAWVEGHLSELGLRDVKVTVAPGSFRVEDAAQFVDVFGGMIGFVVKTWWSEELAREHPLDEVTEMVRAFLEDKYEGGGWEVSWRIICMAGRVEK